MKAIRFVGKFFIITSILFQAFLLYQDKKQGDEFNKNLRDATANCALCLSMRPYLEQYLRLVVVGLLGTSIFMLIFRCWGIKFLTLCGLITLLWVQHHGVFCKIPTIAILDNAPFWHSLGVIGAILYLLADECKGCKKGKKGEKGEKTKQQKTESKPSSNDKRDPKRGRGGNKRD